MDESKHIHYVFYLQLKKELDETFHSMAAIFSKLGISLLPISEDDLRFVDRERKQHLIVLRNDLASAYAIKEIQRSFIETGMASGRLIVYDISSFSQIDNSIKWEAKGMYNFYQLPVSVSQIVVTIAVAFFKERNITEVWPGGRRAKLPSMEKES